MHFSDLPHQEYDVLAGRVDLVDPGQAESGREMTTQSACEACEHDVSSHDAIATRYCKASLEGTADRGCICRDKSIPAKPTTAAERGRSGAPMYGRGRFSGR